jgi:hypothetical protein
MTTGGSCSPCSPGSARSSGRKISDQTDPLNPGCRVFRGQRKAGFTPALRAWRGCPRGRRPWRGPRRAGSR